VGWTGFKYITDIVNGRTHYHDLVYRLVEKYWGQGVASETAKGCLKFGFETLKLNKVFAICDVENTASKNISLECGF